MKLIGVFEVLLTCQDTVPQVPRNRESLGGIMNLQVLGLAKLVVAKNKVLGSDKLIEHRI